MTDTVALEVSLPAGSYEVGAINAAAAAARTGRELTPEVAAQVAAAVLATAAPRTDPVPEPVAAAAPNPVPESAAAPTRRGRRGAVAADPVVTEPDAEPDAVQEIVTSGDDAAKQE